MSLSMRATSRIPQGGSRSGSQDGGAVRPVTRCSVLSRGPTRHTANNRRLYGKRAEVAGESVRRQTRHTVHDALRRLDVAAVALRVGRHVCEQVVEVRRHGAETPREVVYLPHLLLSSRLSLPVQGVDAGAASLELPTQVAHHLLDVASLRAEVRLIVAVGRHSRYGVQRQRALVLIAMVCGVLLQLSLPRAPFLRALDALRRQTVPRVGVRPVAAGDAAHGAHLTAVAVAVRPRVDTRCAEEVRIAALSWVTGHQVAATNIEVIFK